MKTPNFSQLQYLRVACASPVIAIGDPVANAKVIAATCQQLSRQGVAVGVFPELCLSGYSAEDLFYTETLLIETRRALALLCIESTLPLIAVGAPWRLRDGRLINCAVLIGQGRILGMVPKSVQPNYGEFYDLRWFAPGGQVNETEVTDELGSFQIRVDQLFEFDEHLIGVEICEDLWAPLTPSTNAALAGAQIMLNLSASNELISKADYRRDLVRMTSAKNLCAYIYAAAGATESTKDVVFGGHCMVAEAGQIIAEGERFSLKGQTLVTEIDCQKLMHDRAQNTTFGQAARPRAYRIVPAGGVSEPLTTLNRQYPAHPFVPTDEGEFDARAQEILSIQSTGLARRMLAAHTQKLVIGLSGGLDSTLAFLVAKDALAKLNLPPANLYALTLPGPGTTTGTLDNAHGLAKAVNVSLEEISIAPAVEQHLKDLNHQGDHDVVFENAQARERTQILFNMANKVGGIVVGTGDLSELALGWCTFNADHMANYNVNASVPKTMMAYLVRWYAKHRSQPDLAQVLENVLATPISPELIPPKDGEISQHTEALVGPYELHDFFLYHFLRTGADATKIFYLAVDSFEGKYDAQTIQKWLGQFFKRFISQQFKRTTLPPGPKVGSVSLSPRGDWRMPDEAAVEHILQEVEFLL